MGEKAAAWEATGLRATIVYGVGGTLHNDAGNTMEHTVGSKNGCGTGGKKCSSMYPGGRDQGYSWRYPLPPAQLKI